MAFTNKRNTLGKNRLETDLNRINREHVIEMRMHNNQKQRFKNKYAKLDVFDENKYSESGSDVIMYETHNPGFCYRRNGECRLPQSNIKSSSLDMEDLHMLLFTNGEIDIDKVLCLYLLTAHKTETLYPPSKAERTSFLGREQSPLERLVDRSKKRSGESKLIKGLPLYILEAKPYGKKEPIRDPRLLSKTMINDKILQIVTSVKRALEVSNRELIAKFMTMARSRDQLKEVMNKPKMLQFYTNLYGQNIISSCESFHLETPQRENLIMFDIEVEPLEDLVRLIRKNILMKPDTNSWRINYKRLNDQLTERSLISLDSSANERVIYETTLSDLRQSTSNYALRTNQLDEEVEFVLDYNEDSNATSNETTPRMPTFQPKILKNLQMGFSDIPIEEDDLPSPSSLTFPEKLDFDKLANLLSKKVRKEAKSDYRKMLAEQESNARTSTPSSPSKTTSETDSDCKPCKILLKQTTCEACLRKWQQPLPTPKLSKLKKIPLPVLKDTSYYSSKSAQRIADLIDDEVRKFEVAESSMKDHTNKTFSERVCKELAKGNYVATSIEIIDLDELELAKIRQEIKENETQKKFKEFLNRSENK